MTIPAWVILALILWLYPALLQSMRYDFPKHQPGERGIRYLLRVIWHMGVSLAKGYFSPVFMAYRFVLWLIRPKQEDSHEA